MAQDFTGANNLPLLVPSGQFGTRLLGGDDHAAARYIATRPSSFARALFPAADDPLLPMSDDDEEERAEPAWYAPVVPVVSFSHGAPMVNDLTHQIRCRGADQRREGHWDWLVN